METVLILKAIKEFFFEHWKTIGVVLIALNIYLYGQHVQKEVCANGKKDDAIASLTDTLEQVNKGNVISEKTENKLSAGRLSDDEINQEVEEVNVKNRNILDTVIPDDIIMLINKRVEAGNSIRKSH